MATFDINKLRLSDDNKRAVRNIIQSLENARTYCSYLKDTDLRGELETMIERFQKRVENKINDNF